MAFEPQAHGASLAYIKCPKLKQQSGMEALRYVEKYGLDIVHDAVVVSEKNNHLRLILMEEGEKDWSSSLNAFILSEGLACINKREIEGEEDVQSFFEFEEEAKDKSIGLWKHGPVANLSDDEY